MINFWCYWHNLVHLPKWIEQIHVFLLSPSKTYLISKICMLRNFPDGRVVNPAFPTQDAQVWSLVGELRSHMQSGEVKKTQQSNEKLLVESKDYILDSILKTEPFYASISQKLTSIFRIHFHSLCFSLPLNSCYRVFPSMLLVTIICYELGKKESHLKLLSSTSSTL